MHVQDHFLRFLLPFAFAPADAAPVNLRPVLETLQTVNGTEAEFQSGRLWEPLPAVAYARYSEYLLPFFRDFLSGRGDAPACLMLEVNPVLKPRLLRAGFHDLWFHTKSPSNKEELVAQASRLSSAG